VMLLAIGCIGWAVPLNGFKPPTGFSLVPFFWGAGVMLWRLAPFAIVLMLAAIPSRSR
jgi:hypothetical protein